MPMATEDARVGESIKTSREPVGPKRAGDKGSVGDRALMDAVFIVALAWVVLIALAVTLHRHNV